MKSRINGCVASAQDGISIAELMISLALGLIVALAAASLLLASKSDYATVDDSTQLQDTARYALDVIARAVRQISYADWDSAEAPLLTGSTNSPDIYGLDSRSLHSTTPNIQQPIQKSINGSDILAVRFFGSGSGESGDGTVLNCAGFGVPGVESIDSVEEGRGWNILYVAADSHGEPELRCKYRGKKGGWSSMAIARGVESFQVLYGIDLDADGLPNQFMNANAVDELDRTTILTAPNAEARRMESNQKTNWKKVVAIKIALLIRGANRTRSDALSNTYVLFDENDGESRTADNGTVIEEKDIPDKDRNRIRKVFRLTIMLHKQFAGANA